MTFAQNLPFCCILLPILCGVICLSLGSKSARRITTAAFSAECVMSAVILIDVINARTSYTFMMGHFPAPFGNEIRVGALEALMSLAFSVVMLLSATGGVDDIDYDIPSGKQNFFYLMTNFLMAAMLAIIYTNDLFTAYVFIEIITLSACSIIALKEGGKPLIATMSYLIISLIGSALLLLSITLLYTLTGQLLMQNLHLGIQEIARSGSYNLPMFILAGLMITGLCIKCALFPFHSWLPNAHAHATTAASSILSGLIIKCYLLLLSKVFVRVFGLDVVVQLRVGNILITMGILGLIYGSVMAIRQRDIKQMLSYSTVSQVGYICIAIGLSSEAGIAAACFHIIVHASAKSMLFTSAGGLVRASGHKKDFMSLAGSARRDPVSGAAFICGALSMIGIPLFSGFISKLYTSVASVGTPFEAAAILSVVVLSTVLNVMYYSPVVICILAKQRPSDDQIASAGRIVSIEQSYSAGRPAPIEQSYSADKSAVYSGRAPVYNISLAAFFLINLALGVFSQPFFRVIDLGLSVFR